MANKNNQKRYAQCDSDKTRGKRNFRTGKSSKDPRLDKFDPKSATNDPKWYGADPALLRDSASIPFSWAVGTPIDLHNNALSMLPSGQQFTIPGICALRVIPAVGRAEDSSDPINTAAFSVYTFVRHQNSGHANYDAPDLMIYLMAMTQVYSYINFLQRTYGIVSTYAQKNRYMPDRLLEACQIDAADVRAHLADFRYGINSLVNKAASLCVPATMPIFRRHAHLYQNIYIEGTSVKDQIYLYVPGAFWKYKLASDAAGMLEAVMWSKASYTVSDLLEFGNDMLARLIQSEDMNIMSGDILKAYGDANLIKLSPLAVDFPIVPLPDLAVLQQMKNSTVIPRLQQVDLVQSTNHGWLEFKPSCQYVFTDDNYSSRAQTYALQTYLEDRIITVQSADPTPEEIMEATRDTSIGRNFFRSEDGLTAMFDVYPGSDIIYMVSYYYVDVTNGVLDLKSVSLNYCEMIDTQDETAVAAALKAQSVISNFKFHPAHHFISYKAGATSPAFNLADSFLTLDVDNYAVITDATLARMHEAALLSMLNVPSNVKI